MIHDSGEKFLENRLQRKTFKCAVLVSFFSDNGAYQLLSETTGAISLMTDRV